MAAKTAVNVALRAVAMGAPHIPDKVFESLPGGYFKSSKESQSKRHKGRRDHRGSRKDSRSPSSDYYYSDYDYYTSGEEHGDFEKKRDRYKKKQHRRAGSLEDGRRGRSVTRDHDSSGWDPRRPFEVDEMAYRPPPESDPYLPKPYNPADYATPPSAVGGGGAQRPAMDQFDGRTHPYQQYNDERRPSAAEERYRPSSYTPPNVNNYPPPYPSNYPTYNHGQYTPPQSATLPPNDLNSYNVTYNPAAYGSPPGQLAPPPLYRQPSYSQPGSPRGGSRRRRKSKTQRTSSVPRSLSAVRSKFESMDDRDRKLAASVAGAFAGGVIGHGIIKSDMGTAVGAAIGSLALRGWEMKLEKRRDERQLQDQDHSQERHNEKSRHGSRHRRQPDSDRYDNS